MNEQEIRLIVEKQRTCFLAGKTLNVDVRVEALKKLHACVKKYEPEIMTALKKDLFHGEIRKLQRSRDTGVEGDFFSGSMKTVLNLFSE